MAAEGGPPGLLQPEGRIVTRKVLTTLQTLRKSIRRLEKREPCPDRTGGTVVSSALGVTDLSHLQSQPRHLRNVYSKVEYVAILDDPWLHKVMSSITNHLKPNLMTQENGAFEETDGHGQLSVCSF